MSNSNNMNYFANAYINYDSFMNEVYKGYDTKKKSIIKKYSNNAILYLIKEPDVEIYFPERYFAKILRDYILINYRMLVDTNRKVI